MIAADSDVLIDYLNDFGLAAARVDEEIGRSNLCTTAVSRFEVVAGVRSEAYRRRVEALFELIPTLPLDGPSADRAADIGRKLEKQGRKIGMADTLIAGIVLQNRVSLLTRNRGEFERVEDLILAEL